tara:strand:- start:59693 stop:59983 length:291 start_codon:yes stop_codon:yes gene_type:complete
MERTTTPYPAEFVSEGFFYRFAWEIDGDAAALYSRFTVNCFGDIGRILGYRRFSPADLSAGVISPPRDTATDAARSVEIASVKARLSRRAAAALPF